MPKPKLKFDELNQLEKDYFEPMQIGSDDKARRRELSGYLIDAFLFFFAVYEIHDRYNNLLEKQYYENLLADRITEAVTKVTGIDSYMTGHIRELSEQVVDTTMKHAGSAKTNVEPGSNPLNQTIIQKPLIDHLSFKNANPALLNEVAEAPTSPEYADVSATAPSNDDGNEYWLSYRRAEEISQSEANSFLNYTDYVEAKSRGAIKKTWLTMLDNKVRDTHEEVEGQTIGIDDFFHVGDSLMKFPHDLSSSPDPKEVINCRCAVVYS